MQFVVWDNNRPKLLTASVGALPVGAIFQFGGDTLSGSILWCDGASYPTASYPDLYAVIGNKFGGDTENFNVPNLNDDLAIPAVITFSSGVSGGGGGDIDPDLLAKLENLGGLYYSLSTGDYHLDVPYDTAPAQFAVITKAIKNCSDGQVISIGANDFTLVGSFQTGDTVTLQFDKTDSLVFAPSISGGILTVVPCTKAAESSVFVLDMVEATGVKQIAFYAPARFELGDTFEIDNVSYAPRGQAALELQAGCFEPGALLDARVDFGAKRIHLDLSGYTPVQVPPSNPGDTWLSVDQASLLARSINGLDSTCAYDAGVYQVTVPDLDNPMPDRFSVRIEFPVDFTANDTIEINGARTFNVRMHNMNRPEDKYFAAGSVFLVDFSAVQSLAFIPNYPVTEVVQPWDGDLDYEPGDVVSDGGDDYEATAPTKPTAPVQPATMSEIIWESAGCYLKDTHERPVTLGSANRKLFMRRNLETHFGPPPVAELSSEAYFGTMPFAQEKIRTNYLDARSLVYGNGIYLSKLGTSKDGKLWDPIPYNLKQAVFRDGYFVIVAGYSAGRIYRSYDGINLQDISPAFNPDENWCRVALDPRTNKIVALSQPTDFGVQTHFAEISADGAGSIMMSALGDVVWEKIIARPGGGFLGFANTNTTSEYAFYFVLIIGNSAFRYTLPGYYPLDMVVDAFNIYYATGFFLDDQEGSATLKSSDGVSWTRHGVDSRELMTVHNGEVLTCEATAITTLNSVVYSPDTGLVPKTYPLPIAAVYPGGGAAVGDNFCVANTKASNYHTPASKVVSYADIPGDYEMATVVRVGNLLCHVAKSGSTITVRTRAGNSWVVQSSFTLPGQETRPDLICGGLFDLVVASYTYPVPPSLTYQTYITRSSDLINWTTQSNVFPWDIYGSLGNFVGKLTYVNDKFVLGAIRPPAWLCYSTDGGQTFTKSTYEGWYDSPVYVAPYYYMYASRQFFRSTDLNTWELVSAAEAGSSLYRLNNKFVRFNCGASGNVCKSSTDLVNWAAIPQPAQYLRATSGDNYIALHTNEDRIWYYGLPWTKL